MLHDFVLRIYSYLSGILGRPPFSTPHRNIRTHPKSPVQSPWVFTSRKPRTFTLTGGLFFCCIFLPHELMIKGKRALNCLLEKKKMIATKKISLTSYLTHPNHLTHLCHGTKGKIGRYERVEPLEGANTIVTTTV